MDGAATGAGQYTIEVSADSARLHATLEVREEARGPLAGLAGLPDLGAIAITGVADGPWNGLTAKLTFTAGRASAMLEGTADLIARTVDARVAASAPAMRPAPDVAWSSIGLEGRVHGPFLSPDATGRLTVSGLTAAGAAVGTLRADLAGQAGGGIAVRASLDGVRMPGPAPELLAGGPVSFDASLRLDQPDRPVRFTVRHPLLSAEGTASAGGDTPRVHVRLTLADLAPFAAIGGVAAQGGTVLDIDAASSQGTTDLTVKGTIGITGGPAQLPGLVGKEGAIDLHASVRGTEVRLTRLAVRGAAFAATASGRFANNQPDLDWTLTVARLDSLSPALSGTAEARGRISGPLDSLSLSGDLTVDAAAKNIRPGRVVAHVSAEGVPRAPSVQVTAEGRFLDAPVALALNAAQRADGLHVSIARAAWKSLSASGDVTLAHGAATPVGGIRVSMTRLEDLAPLLERSIGGRLALSVAATPEATRLSLTVGQLIIAGMGEVASAALNATITDLGADPGVSLGILPAGAASPGIVSPGAASFGTVPPGIAPSGVPPAGRAMVNGVLTLDGVVAGGLRGGGRLTANGPVTALPLSLTADIADLSGAPAHVEATGTLNAPARVLMLAAARASWKNETLRLLAPVRAGFVDGLSLDRLRLGFRRAELEIAGRVAPALALQVTLKNLPADIAALIAPEYAADGTLSGEARLTGATVQMRGTVRLRGTGLHMRNGPGQALPAAEAMLDATLNGDSARVDGRLTAGPSRLTLAGTVPFGGTGRLDARAGGMLDLAMLDPLLAAGGRRVRGKADLALGLGGTLAAPRLNGTARLTGGEVRDAALGVSLSGIAATVQAEGDTIRLTQFTAQAGPGTLSGGGTIGLSGARPVALALRAANARLLSSDLITAFTDLDLTLSGALTTRLALGGTVLVRQADIRVPERLPNSVVVLLVREAGKPFVPPPPARPMPDIALALTLNAPERIFLRGRGLDVELGGRIVFGGTAANPVPQGELRLRRGTFSLAGQSLALTEGSIAFAGGDLTDPAVKLVATSQTAALTATVTVSGGVSNPKIALSSTPDLPQDEILAQLLFNSYVARLNPFQVAQIAAALASLSGVSSPIGDPLEGIRSTLGLDRLSVGTGRGGGPVLEAGRYLAPGVHVGVKQGATGGETQATVQIDIAKGLKLETTAGTGSSSASGGASGSGASVGVTYQFEY